MRCPLTLCDCTSSCAWWLDEERSCAVRLIAKRWDGFTMKPFCSDVSCNHTVDAIGKDEDLS